MLHTSLTFSLGRMSERVWLYGVMLFVSSHCHYIQQRLHFGSISVQEAIRPLLRCRRFFSVLTFPFGVFPWIEIISWRYGVEARPFCRGDEGFKVSSLYDLEAFFLAAMYVGVRERGGVALRTHHTYR